jgi:hypothetical protein
MEKRIFKRRIIEAAIFGCIATVLYLLRYIKIQLPDFHFNWATNSDLGIVGLLTCLLAGFLSWATFSYEPSPPTLTRVCLIILAFFPLAVSSGAFLLLFLGSIFESKESGWAYLYEIFTFFFVGLFWAIFSFFVSFFKLFTFFSKLDLFLGIFGIFTYRYLLIPPIRRHLNLKLGIALAPLDSEARANEAQ